MSPPLGVRGAPLGRSMAVYTPNFFSDSVPDFLLLGARKSRQDVGGGGDAHDVAISLLLSTSWQDSSNEATVVIMRITDARNRMAVLVADSGLVD